MLPASKSADSKLAELLLEWETLRARGMPVTPEALCGACPELVEALRQRADALSKLDQVLDLSAYAEQSRETRRNDGAVSEQAPAGSRPASDRRQGSPPGYEIVSEVGRGGVGIVFKARQLALDRLVALKMLLGGARARPKDLARFEAEARAVARLQHPNIVQIYDVGRLDDCPYLVLEFMGGGDLDAVLGGRALGALAAATLLETVARAVHHAHQNGIIHRDLKPGNILLTESHRLPNGDVHLGDPKITDFGLARWLGSTSKLTGTGVILGTPAYMAPEQASGRGDLVGPATDVYALGAVLYHLVTGAPPLESEGDWETTRDVLKTEPVPPSQRRPGIPAPLDAICMRCLRKDPARRYASAKELADDLHCFVTGRPVTTEQSGHTSSACISGRPTSRRAWLAGAGGLAAVVGGFGLAHRWLTQPTRPALRVGLLHSLTGTMALSERPVLDAERLAIAELNRNGGLLGRPLEAIEADGRSHEGHFAREAERLIVAEKVSVLVGCWTSASRKAVVRVVERHKHLLLYPVQFEGLEISPNVAYFGPAPNQQILPAVAWARAKLGKTRFFLVGSDYIFPRAAAAIVKDQLQRSGLKEVGEKYVPLGSVSLTAVVREISDAQPDAILNFINGDSNVAFFRRLREGHVRPATTPTLSFSVSDQELLSVDRDLMAGDYLASDYFASLPGEANRRFVAQVRARDARQVATDAMATAYGAVHFWARAVERAGSADPEAVRTVIASFALEGPTGLIRLDPASRYAYRSFRLGQIRPDGGIDLVAESAQPLKPVPFPPTRTPEAWAQFLAEWQTRWGGQWSAPA